MNKKVLAVAVAATMAAPVIVQADTDLYGRVNVGVQMNSEDNGTDTDTVADGGSRFGMRGSEDLDNGMNVFYRFEFYVDGATTSIATGDRLSYVGLDTGSGRISFGRQWSAGTNYLGTFIDQSISLGSSGQSYRLSNDLQYSHSFGAVDIQVDMVIGNSTTTSSIEVDGSDADGDGSTTDYITQTTTSQPDDLIDRMQIGVGYNIGDAGRVTFLHDNTVNATAGADDETRVGIGGQYNVGGGVQIGALYQTISGQANTTTTNDASLLGLRVSYSSGDIFAQMHLLSYSDDDDSSTSDDHTDHTFFQIGKNLSSSSKVYLEYRTRENEVATSAYNDSSILMSLRKDF